MSRIVVGPFNRVEGDLEVRLDVADGRVRSAWVNSPLYRGFEQILIGKDPRDALVYTPRICGICSVSQSMAAARALADAQGIRMPRNGELVTNLMLATENVADHFTHFYLFFMPDFARAVYADEPWYETLAPRFRAVAGDAGREAAGARAEFLHLMGILAGKWPHSLSLQPGGSTRPVTGSERVRLLALISNFRRFLERRTFGLPLEAVAELRSSADLHAWADDQAVEASDLLRFLYIAKRLNLHQLGRAGDRFMSYGGYSLGGKRLFADGVWDGGPQRFNPEAITEDVSHSWMGGESPQHPRRGVTVPDADKADAYSWCKAPRLSGRVLEVGALARQLIDGHPLIRDVVGESGGNVRNRVLARLLEIARVVLAMERWVKQIRPDQPFCRAGRPPRDAEGVGLVEAARGSLGHWLQVRDGAIANYQIVAPTTWNFSPRDANGVAGALEQALVGAPVRPGETEPVSVQHVVRSFDPCMVCTVH